MHFLLSDPQEIHTLEDLLVIPYYSNGAFTTSGEAINQHSQNKLHELIKNAEFEGKYGSHLLLNGISGVAARHVLIIGAGDKPLSTHRYKTLIQTTHQAIKTMGFERAIFLLHELQIEDLSLEENLRLQLNTLCRSSYHFTQFKSQKPAQPLPIMTINFPVSNPDDQARKQLLEEEAIIANAQDYNCDLCNTPANICTPTYILDKVKQLVAIHSQLKLEIINEDKAEKLGMGAFHAVSKGSDEPGHVIILQYNGGEKGDAPVAFVGKGVTFDTGGNNIKPAPGMVPMKFDMGGAACVLSAFKACVELKLPVNVVVALACAENMISGRATRPSDIVTTLSGQTVEIYNTDAEGRLVMCDAITYVQQNYKPKAVIDVATLTGAAVGAFGAFHTPFFTNNKQLKTNLLTAAQESFEAACHLPVTEEYDFYLKSEFADMVNARFTPDAKLAVAARFLQRFIENDTPWAHIDIAGTAVLPQKGEAASGRNVAWLVKYLTNMAKKHHESN